MIKIRSDPIRSDQIIVGWRRHRSSSSSINKDPSRHRTMLADLLYELAEEPSGHALDSSGVTNHGGAIEERLLADDAAAPLVSPHKFAISKAPPLVLACFDGNITHVRHLLGCASGTNEDLTAAGLRDEVPIVHERDANLDRTPLCYACQWGGYLGAQMAAMLLNRRADINGKPGRGVPLLVASQGAHLDIVRLLLERDADPNHVAADTGDSALLLAVKSGSIEVLLLLLLLLVPPTSLELIGLRGWVGGRGVAALGHRVGAAAPAELAGRDAALRRQLPRLPRHRAAAHLQEGQLAHRHQGTGLCLAGCRPARSPRGTLWSCAPAGSPHLLTR